MSGEHVRLGRSVELSPGATAIPFFCEHCGDEIMVVAPVNITTMCSFARWYEDEHAECVLDKKEKEK